MTSVDDIVSSPPSTESKKRSAPHEDSPGRKPLNLKGTQFMMPTPPESDRSNDTSPNCVNADGQGRAASPAASDSTMSVEVTSSYLASSVHGGVPAFAAFGSTAPPAKRRKLTLPEKIAKQQEREAREREKAEKKAQKEDERVRKDEVKAQKDEEKRAKAEEKEAKKREKEHSEEIKSQEKLKKERAQMRLGVFFQAKPSTPSKNGVHNESQPDAARRRSLSLESYDAIAEQICASAPDKTPSQIQKLAPEPLPSTVSDYHKTFLPFEVPSHCTIATSQWTSFGDDDRTKIFDGTLNDPTLKEKYDLGLVSSYASLEHYYEAGSARRGLQHQTVEELASIIEGTAKQPIDLTNDHALEAPLDQLRSVPIKHISFHEDVRPAYQGTYTKIHLPRIMTKICRNPLTRARPDTNYDYDSEVEWEEPEEGDEEIMSDEDDDSDREGDADEIDGFLDDSEDIAKAKRRAVTSELIPETTGLCWADEANCFPQTSNNSNEMKGMRLQVLLPSLAGQTIDPFSTSYWRNDTLIASAAQNSDERTRTGMLGLMAAPRPPLGPRPNSTTPAEHSLLGAAQGEKGPITSVAATQGAKRGPKPAPRFLNKEDMEEFKEAVVGSPLGKLDLHKGLKSRFPKMTHDTIKETLATQFAQVGLTKADKKWVFVGTL